MRRQQSRINFKEAIVLLAIVTAGVTVAGLIVAKIVADQAQAKFGELQSSSPWLKLLSG